MSAEGPSPKRVGLLVLSYVPVLGLVALPLSRDREVRWHARNGQLLFGLAFAAGLVLTVVGILLPSTTCLYAVAMVDPLDDLRRRSRSSRSSWRSRASG